MKRNLLIFGLLAVLAGRDTFGFDHTHAGWAVVLDAVVDDRGRVDYAGVKKNPEPLHAYLRDLAGIDQPTYHTWSREQRLAYLINLYNAQTIDLVSRHYPVSSIKDIGTFMRGPWGQPVVSLFGRITTLDNLEHKIIRAMFADPRTHFALVCAARSAPPLRAEPYVAGRLNEQLDDQARRFLGDPSRNRLDPDHGVLYLSSIFKWYAADFESTADSVLAYVAPFMTAADQAIMKERTITIRYLNYDWSLNDGPRGGP